MINVGKQNSYQKYIDVVEKLKRINDFPQDDSESFPPPPILTARNEEWSESANHNYVFISYSHHDYKLVYRDLRKLWAINANYWYDKEFISSNTSDNWRKTVNEIFMDPNCVGAVFYFSANSFKSESVYHEIKACISRLTTDESFPYKIVLLEGNDIFEIQNKCKLSVDFTSQRLIDIHTIVGSDNINFKYDKEGNHIYDIAGWFASISCIGDLDFNSQTNVIARKDYIIIDNTLISYYGTKEEFCLEDGDSISIVSSKAIASPTIKTIVIPDGVIKIEDFAIISCTNLESIYIPPSVEYLSFFALSNFNYRNIIISDQNKFFKTDKYGFVYTIDENRNAISLFASPNKNKVKNLVIEDSVVSVNDFAISCCDFLETVVFSKHLKRIGFWGVKENKKLKAITLYPEIEYISPGAFYETNIEIVRFMGTKEEWQKHSLINENETLDSFFKNTKVLFNK